MLRRASLMAIGEDSGELRCELLGAGVDRCVGSDCGEREIVADLRALGRHASRLIRMPLITGTLVLETAAGRMTRIDREPNISAKLVGQELLLCEALALRPGSVVGKRDLKEYIWREQVSDHTLYRLRCRANRRVEKLQVVKIENAHGVGYRYEFADAQ
jgi:DNA-binding response OmpR family regulator